MLTYVRLKAKHRICPLHRLGGSLLLWRTSSSKKNYYFQFQFWFHTPTLDSSNILKFREIFSSDFWEIIWSKEPQVSIHSKSQRTSSFHETTQ
jgi:hypothetical protein